MRDARVDDAHVVCDLRRDMFAELGHTAGPWTASSQSMLRTTLEDGTVLGVVAEYGTEVVGFALAYLDRRLPSPGRLRGLKAHVGGLYTAPGFRRVGTGSAVLTRLLDRLRSIGVDQVELFASVYGQSLYASAGFTPINSPLQHLRFSTGE